MKLKTRRERVKDAKIINAEEPTEEREEKEELERKEKNGSIGRQDPRTFYLREYVELVERRKTTLLAWAVGYQNLLVIFPT